MSRYQLVVEAKQSALYSGPGGEIWELVLSCGCRTWRPRSRWVTRQPRRALCDKHPKQLPASPGGSSSTEDAS